MDSNLADIKNNRNFILVIKQNVTIILPQYRYGIKGENNGGKGEVLLATWQYYLVGWINLHHHLVFLLISL